MQCVIKKFKSIFYVFIIVLSILWDGSIDYTHQINRFCDIIFIYHPNSFIGINYFI